MQGNPTTSYDDHNAIPDEGHLPNPTNDGSPGHASAVAVQQAAHPLLSVPVQPRARVGTRRRSKRVGTSARMDVVDIEMDGKEAPESMEHDKLKVVHLKKLTVGKDYEYQDAYGNWYPVRITEETKTGEYVGQSLFSKNKVYEHIKASQCIESAAPHKENWVSYWFWTIFDLILFTAIVVLLVHGDKNDWYDFLTSTTWLGYIWQFLIIPILFVARIYWYFLNRAKSRHSRAVQSVKSFVSRKVEIDGKQVYLVGTMHVSPGSVEDVQRAADEIDPDVYMIELDFDRLAAMKEAENPPICDQWLFNKDGKSVRGVHTDWNSALHKRNYTGTLTFEKEHDLHGKILLAPMIKGNVASFVYAAEKRGAEAVFFLDRDGKTVKKPEKLPTPRASVKSVSSTSSYESLNESTMSETPIAREGAPNAAEGYEYHASSKQIESDSCCSLSYFCCKTGRNTSPEIPCYLVPNNMFNMQDEGLAVEFQVRSGNVGQPRTCRRMCCQTTCLTLTGIGVMYGLIRMAGCKVGGEFLLADKLARERGKALATIDMGMGRLGAALLDRLIPYPRNLWYMIIAWASVPRHLLTWLFLPMGHKLDIVLNMLYGFARFKCRTWLAFLVGVGAATAILTGVILLIQYGSKAVATGTSSAAGSDEEESDKIGDTVFLVVGVAIQVYLYPVVYKGLLDSRDEQMYRGVVAQIRRRPNAEKFMIVIGAAHSNGMIRRMYERGFMPDGNAREARREWAPYPFNKGFLFNYLYYGNPIKTE